MAIRFEFQEGTNSARDLEETMTLRQAVDAVLNSYSKHTRRRGKMNADEFLHEFWQIKLSQQENVPPSSGLVTYEMEPGERPPYVSYVTLPGGSCFGTFEHCKTKADAKCSAAKVALMNSVLNEHPSRRITDDVIEKAVQEAEETENTLTIPSEDTDRPCKAIGAYRFMLTAMKGKSLLEFQELMTIFQLLNWNGSLQALRDKGLSRQHVLSHYKSRTIDDDIRSQMALDWVSREQMNPDIVAGCYEKACMEIKELCLRGRELRFAKEKKEILGLALQQLGEA